VATLLSLRISDIYCHIISLLHFVFNDIYMTMTLLNEAKNLDADAIPTVLSFSLILLPRFF